jgi:solute carrier family 25 protein 33/36
MLTISVGGMTGAIVTSPFDVVKVCPLSTIIKTDADEQTRLQSDLFRHHAPETIRSAAGARTGVSGGLYQFVDTIYLMR